MIAPFGFWNELLLFCGASHLRHEHPVFVDLGSGDVVWRRSLKATTRELTGLSGDYAVGLLGLSAGHIILTADRADSPRS